MKWPGARCAPFVLLGIGGVVPVDTADAQFNRLKRLVRSDQPVEEALDLVVSVRAIDSAAAVGPIYGAGVVIGAHHDSVFIVTARHTLRVGGRLLPTISVAFHADSTKRVQACWLFDGVRGTPAANGKRAMADRQVASACRVTEGGIGRAGPDSAVLAASPNVEPEPVDLAVIAVVRQTSVPDLRRFANQIPRVGDEVHAVGCPNDTCWEIFPDERMLSLGEFAFYRSFTTYGGTSGGALFDASGDVVGMVLDVKDYAGSAMPIDVVKKYVDSKRGGLMQLRKSEYPRRGYRQSVGAIWLSGGSGPKTGFPSIRIDIAGAALRRFEWQSSALRMARRDVVTTTALAGIGYPVLRRSRVVVRSFAEAGFGTADGHIDEGGYFTAPASGPSYVPAWVPIEGTAVGGGGGLSLQIYLPHRMIAEFLGAWWGFSVPETLPQPAGISAGVGLRIGVAR